jgi:cation transport regulator ChaC
VWGAAYRIAAARAAEVDAYLAVREVNGYSVRFAAVQPAEGGRAPIRCRVYVGLPENAQFVGVQQPQALAEHIWRSRGPSGENGEYLLMLEQALGGLGPGSADVHVSDLADRVRALAASARVAPADGAGVAMSVELGRIQREGGGQQEEVAG